MSDIYTISMIISIAIFTITTHITPGPTNIILLSSILNFGYKKSLPFMIGNIISYPLMMALTGFGVAVFLFQYPMIMTALKVVGISYLCWMAYNIARDTSSYDTNNSKTKKPFTFVQALFYPLINPKAWILYTSAISVFVSSSEDSMPQIMIIVLFTLISMLITVYIWAKAGSLIKKFIHKEKSLKRLNQIMALLLLASIIPIL